MQSNTETTKGSEIYWGKFQTVGGSQLFFRHRAGLFSRFHFCFRRFQNYLQNQQNHLFFNSVAAFLIRAKIKGILIRA